MPELGISYAALEQLELKIEYRDAMEVYGIFSRILDTFSRLISNVKINLLSFSKKFKRSELHFYHDSKKRAIENLYKTRYFNRDLMVPIPSGMKVSYINAISVIEDLFKELNIESTTDTLLSYFKKESLESPNDITTKINNLTKSKLEKELQTVFSSKKTVDVKISTIIDNLQQVKEVDTKILAFEDILKQVPAICDKLNLIEKEIDKIVTELENKKEIDRNFVKALHLLVKTAAFQYDAYGVCLAEFLRIEHNFVLVLEKLVRDAADKK